MKGLFIINPNSGTKKIQRRVPEIVDKLLSEPDCSGITMMYTHGRDDALNATKALTPGQYDFVVAVGGDGTVNEVVSGLYLSGSGIPMAIIAAGTTNDFATSLGLPRTVPEVVKMLKDLRTVPLDLGYFNGRYFYNEAAGGALSAIAHTTPSELKKRFGHLAYLGEGFRKFGDLKLSSVPLVFEIDGEEETIDTVLFTLTNTKRSGGFSKISPDARVNDGLLDLVVIKKVDPKEVFPLLFKITNGAHLGNQKVYYRQLRTLKIRAAVDAADADNAEKAAELKAAEEFPLDIDGENGGNLPMEVEVVPGAVSLIIPANSKNLRGNLYEPESVADG